MPDVTTGSGVLGYASGSPTIVDVSGGSIVVVASLELDCASEVDTTSVLAVIVAAATHHRLDNFDFMHHLRRACLVRCDRGPVLLYSCTQLANSWPARTDDSSSIRDWCAPVTD
jgi:hypothetical protein